VGGVPGHKGSTLERSATPEHIVEHLPPPQCEAWGVQTFCITRSYLSTLKKQGRELLPSLEATFNGDDPLMGLI